MLEMVVPAVVANAEAGSCRDHQRWGWSQPPTRGWGLSRPPARHDRQRWGWGVLRPSMLGLGMAVVVISAGAFKKRKKEIRTYLPGAQRHAQTKRMDSRAAQARLTSAYTSVAVRTTQEDLQKCQQAHTYLPEMQYPA